jgi:hypothetical protein
MSPASKGNRTHLLPLLLLAALAAPACDTLGSAVGRGNEPEAPSPAVSPTDLAVGPVASFARDVPSVEIPDLDMEMALTLVAMPLSCVDRPHAAPRDRSTYLDEIVAARRPGYERNRAFYGCWDWHSAVNSTWAMVRIYKEFPNLPIGGLVIEKLADHLSTSAIEGEIEFFEENVVFERPYGWGWLLALYAELRTWDHPDAGRWADNLEPLATMFSERMVAWLPHLERPSRSGAHSNTAFSLAMMLPYTRVMEDTDLRQAIEEAAVRLFAGDVRCPTGYEPWGSDFLSPCLEEAALMAAVLASEDFVAWFDDFMPEVTSPDFLPLTMPVDTSADEGGAETAAAEGPEDPEAGGEVSAEAGEGPSGEEAPEAGAAESEGADDADAADAEERRRADAALRSLAGRSHLIGLAFVRADAMNRIAAALPSDDPRVEAYRKLARLHGSMGFDAMFDADYAGSHWIGTFALKYLLSAR